jgi:hypothetical protein
MAQGIRSARSLVVCGALAVARLVRTPAWFMTFEVKLQVACDTARKP